MQVETIETPSLGDRSYVVHDGRLAAVIDPQRDLDRLDEVLDRAGVEVTAVLETHLHNDYVSGGLALARRTGAPYHVPAGAGATFEHVATGDGAKITVGDVVLEAVHTPGHTRNHLSYVVSEGGAAGAVLTGGGLLHGSVGRTDLVSQELTEPLTREQYRSVRRLAARLGDDVRVLPTHGFGSFCSTGATTETDESTVGRERERNQALTVADEDAFVDDLLAGLDAYPTYYAHMAPLNRAGPGPADLSPAAEVDLAELRRRIHAGHWVVDLRDRRSFAAVHLPGTINVELADTTSTYVGWLMPWGTPLTLIGDAPEDVAAAQRQLVRIGIDRPAARADSAVLVGADTGSYAVSDFAALAAAREAGEDPVVLDVRRDREWDDGHLHGAVHVPLHELEERLGDVPERPVWVHCSTGHRASIAASLLLRSGGRDVTLIDDEFERAPDHVRMAP